MKSKTKSKILKNKSLVFIFLLFLLVPFIALVPIVTVKAALYTDISVSTAFEMINNHTQYPNLIILDVREQSEYNVNHLHDVILIPRLEIDARISELEPYNDTEIIVYCLSGGRSAMASENLAVNHNFTKIYNMLGGITAWIAAGYPVWTSPNGIGFSNIIFVLVLFGIISVLILYFKKQKFKILQ
ncbi:hypothetical protein LCGC14_1615300 [marine sediment metagenome]|uniref:Rhodanese domain-containing protein n=1 Tax=marine sediment metagenome TaxID=412755 RepID=A0A0F9L750_9ZZZZ